MSDFKIEDNGLNHEITFYHDKIVLFNGSYMKSCLIQDVLDNNEAWIFVKKNYLICSYDGIPYEKVIQLIEKLCKNRMFL